MTDTFTDLSEADLDALVERVQHAAEHQLALSSEDLQLLLRALLTLGQLQSQLAEQDMTLRKLRKLAGIVKSSEKLADLVPTSEERTPPKKRQRTKRPNTPPPDEVVEQRCEHQLEGLEKGQICPECERGKLYKYEPAVRVHISGQAPLVRTQHILQRLRCNTCGAYFTAPVPEEVKQDGGDQQRYGYSARALMALHKCFAGTPYYRQQSLQQLLGLPVSASTIFDQCEHLANAVQPIVRCLIRQAADAVQYQLDDTTNRILNQRSTQKPDRRTGKLKERTGVYTSGVIATLSNHQCCVLFQTNIGHVGEWIDEIVATRRPDAPTPVLMSDGLSSNRATRLGDYHEAFCNAHARREFVEVLDHFPDIVPWILEQYGLIWTHEAYCQEHELGSQQRLDYHRRHALPVMKQLRDWGQQQLDTEKIEENSGLGKALGYLLRHFEPLTAFCRWPDVPLDNNQMEATLKLIIRGRKNSLFYKSLAGAAVGDVLTSLIATCDKARINTFDYLVVVQRHAEQIKSQPELWLPWNYRQTLEALNIAEQTAA